MTVITSLLHQSRTNAHFPFSLVLPSAPRNVNVTFVNQTATGLRWQPPEVTGDQSSAFYDVECRTPCKSAIEKNCVEKACERNVIYMPYKKGLNETQVMVVNLSSFVNYTFRIYARNRVSEVARRKHGIAGNFSAITVTTIGSSKLCMK